MRLTMMDELAIFSEVRYLRGIIGNRCGGGREEGMCVYLGRSRRPPKDGNPFSDEGLDGEKSAEVIVPRVRP